jgi:hypothetical protein
MLAPQKAYLSFSQEVMQLTQRPNLNSCPLWNLPPAVLVRTPEDALNQILDPTNKNPDMERGTTETQPMTGQAKKKGPKTRKVFEPHDKYLRSTEESRLLGFQGTIKIRLSKQKSH